MSETPQLFDRLPPEERTALRAAARRRRFAKGDTIFFEGDLGDSLHVIEKGHVAIRTSTPRGDIATLVVLVPGDSFGEQALLDSESRRTAAAVCLDAVETLSIGRRDFEHLRSRLPLVDRFLVEVLAAQVRRLSAMVLESLHLDADTRVFRRLASLAATYASADIVVTQEDLASMAGTTRPTVNKALRGAEERGMIELARGRIRVLDEAALRKRARL
ncbi:MAG: Crp/Fnr family transcriptional regulator [Microthrixaceae bacterium]|nr:Crp/Fnr family transcriptional regulator [Microthrixaceae bacterium]